jgi:tRNA modification GTPase
MALALAPPDRTVLVRNKSDLPPVPPDPALANFPRQVTVAARHGHDLAALQAVVVAYFGGTSGGEPGDGVVLSERRHREALAGAVAAVGRLLAAQAAAEPLECLACELREALAALGQITGETTPEAILEQIFSRFCIGK